MFGKRITLFKIFDFNIRIDLSWLIIVVLISWTLAKNVFPTFYEDLSNQQYIIMGILGALGLFISIILHELSHSLVARKFGMPINGITLFIFGGVAEMEEEPPSAKAEFFMAIAGPLASIAIGGVCLGIYAFAESADWSPIIIGVLNYIWLINFVLAGFNLIPAFPLDGGRVLRSALWAWKDNLNWATKIASNTGSTFGFVLIFLGIINIVTGNVVGGIWWLLIGIFLRHASQVSYKKIVIRNNLEGEPVRKFMKTDPVTVSPSISVEDFVEEYMYCYDFKMFPVVENGQLEGCITTKAIKEISKEEWSRKTVGDLLKSCASDNTISPDADVMDALSSMHKYHKSRLMVVGDRELVGILALKDLMHFISTKVDLEGK